MELTAFQKLKDTFATADTDGKIAIYSSTEGLTKTQYRELLMLFPMSELSKLEDALQ